MTTAVTERSDSSTIPTRRIALLAMLLLGVLTLAAGCKSPKKKATEIVKDALKKCKKADGDFHQVQLLAGDDSTEILAKTCQEKMGEVKVEEGHSATVEIGPYTWEAGIEATKGLWVLQSITWETLDQARNRLDREDPGKNSLKRAIELLGKAQATYPESGWIRLKRLETLLELREKTRSLDSKEGIKLGEKTASHLEETLDWAKSNGDRSTEARARLQLIDYYQEFARTIQDAKGALGSNDEYYKKSIEVAERKGNEKEAEKYRKELEQMKEERPKMRKMYTQLIQNAHAEMCGRLSHLKIDGIKESNLKDRVQSTKQSIDCRKLLEKNDEKGNDQGSSEK